MAHYLKKISTPDYFLIDYLQILVTSWLILNKRQRPNLGLGRFHQKIGVVFWPAEVKTLANLNLAPLWLLDHEGHSLESWPISDSFLISVGEDNMSVV